MDFSNQLTRLKWRGWIAVALLGLMSCSGWGTSTPETRALAAGDRIPVIRGLTTDGFDWALDLTSPDMPVVLYIARRSQRRPSDEANLQALAKATEGTYRFVRLVAVGPGGTLDYWDSFGVPPTALIPTPSQGTLGLSRTPLTAVVSTAGVVTRVWIGVYSDEVLEQLEQYFRVTLPGQLPAPGRCIGPDTASALYSPGAVLSIDGRREVCGRDGSWTLQDGQ